MKTLIKKIFSTVMCMVMLVTGTAFYTLAADSKKIDYYQKIQEEIAEFESLNIDECSLADYDYAFYGITIAKQAKPDDSEEVLKNIGSSAALMSKQISLFTKACLIWWGAPTHIKKDTIFGIRITVRLNFINTPNRNTEYLKIESPICLTRVRWCSMTPKTLPI